MRVIDGMHRLRAAMLIGRPTMRALLVDCSEAEIIVLAIQENARHGLPLSLPDREAAAFRLLASATNWSDRMIAETAGLSPGTVAQIRARSTTGSGQSNRVGRTALKNPELWLVVSGFWLMVTGWLQVDSGIVMASGSP
jgi:hypothetical protein